MIYKQVSLTLLITPQMYECMLFTYEKQTFNEEGKHTRSAVGFGFSFGLVVFENP